MRWLVSIGPGWTVQWSSISCLCLKWTRVSLETKMLHLKGPMIGHVVGGCLACRLVCPAGFLPLTPLLGPVCMVVVVVVVVVVVGRPRVLGWHRWPLV